MVYAKFFLPGTGWTWYVTEGSPQGEEFLFFGFVVGMRASSAISCFPNSKKFAASWDFGWSAIWRSAKAGSLMWCPRRCMTAPGTQRPRDFLGLFFVAPFRGCMEWL